MKRLPSLIDLRGLQTELGVTAHVAERIMRQLPIVRPPHVRKLYVRVSDVDRYIKEATVELTDPSTPRSGVSAWIRTRVTATGEKRYMCLYRRGGRGSRVENANTFRTQREARARRDLISGWLALGLDPRVEMAKLFNPTPVRGLGEWFDAFIESRVDVNESTIGGYRQARDHLVPALADVPVGELRPSHIQEWINQADMAPATVYRQISVLRQVLDYADLEPNPARSKKVRLPADTSAEPTPPSTREFHEIVVRVVGEKRLLLRLIECCGLRVSEATGLTVGDVDFEQGRIRISRARTKGRTSGQRWLPVPAELLAEMAELPTVARGRDARLFRETTENVRRAMGTACAAAGISHYHPHDLRHRRISLWIAHRFDLLRVKTWAGHAKASMSSDRYGHVIAEPHLDEWREFWLEAYRAEREDPAYIAAGPVEDSHG